MKFFQRLSDWRLRRAYRAIARCEARHFGEGALSLRINFASQTIRGLNGGWVAQGMPRAERRRLLRALSRGFS